MAAAQRAAAILAPSLEQIVSTLRRGETERAKLDSPRWQAGYDLAMGRSDRCVGLIKTDGDSGNAHGSNPLACSVLISHASGHETGSTPRRDIR
jgi:hypothetical protein